MCVFFFFFFFFLGSPACNLGLCYLWPRAHLSSPHRHPSTHLHPAGPPAPHPAPTHCKDLSGPSWVRGPRLLPNNRPRCPGRAGRSSCWVAPQILALQSDSLQGLPAGSFSTQAHSPGSLLFVGFFGFGFDKELLGKKTPDERSLERFISFAMGACKDQDPEFSAEG